MQADPIDARARRPATSAAPPPSCSGQAYVTAYNLMRAQPRARSSSVADILIERRELHGDEVTELLDSVDLDKPEIDLLVDPEAWPKP